MRKTIPLMILVATLAAVVPLALAQRSEEVPQKEEKVAKSKDPVCKMMVVHDPDLSVEHEGTVYYFCMKRDLEAFEQEPEKYLNGEDHSHPDPNLNSEIP
jgi:YHS domain-containing protein